MPLANRVAASEPACQKRPVRAASSYPGGAVTDSGAAWNPGSLVSARITPLRLEAFEQLPKHARRCVYWEVDPSTLQDYHLSDPEFEKEAWVSMVMLEWGSCGQVAVHCRDTSATAGGDEVMTALDPGDPCLGYAF